MNAEPTEATIEMSAIRIIDLAEADVHEEAGLISRRVVRKAHGADDVSLNVSTLHDGYHDPAVSYPDHDEIIYVLSGTAELTIDGATASVGPGKAVWVPRGATYGYRVTKGPNEVIAVFSPAKF